ncbi:unnamed protein product [Fraxinus pennsylvanica]|uniref:Secreted protein n=1 Tax=Fraxinus pennsylvanica TaxID=56036 RepID=A0AAD2AGB9_9LAMI|nr:unnamed protein product [Fraxinus pennsylvanica]
MTEHWQHMASMLSALTSAVWCYGMLPRTSSSAHATDHNTTIKEGLLEGRLHWLCSFHGLKQISELVKLHGGLNYIEFASILYEFVDLSRKTLILHYSICNRATFWHDTAIPLLCISNVKRYHTLRRCFNLLLEFRTCMIHVIA